jgi:hypothetical protein
LAKTGSCCSSFLHRIGWFYFIKVGTC